MYTSVVEFDSVVTYLGVCSGQSAVHVSACDCCFSLVLLPDMRQLRVFQRSLEVTGTGVYTLSVGLPQFSAGRNS